MFGLFSFHWKCLNAGAFPIGFISVWFVQVFTYQNTNKLVAIIPRIPVCSYTFCSCNGSAPTGRLTITWINDIDGLVQDCSISIAGDTAVLH